MSNISGLTPLENPLCVHTFVVVALLEKDDVRLNFTVLIIIKRVYYIWGPYPNHCMIQILTVYLKHTAVSWEIQRVTAGILNNTEWPLSQLNLISAPSTTAPQVFEIKWGFSGAPVCIDKNSSHLYEFISLDDSSCYQLLSIVLSGENPLHRVSLNGPWALQGGERWNSVMTLILSALQECEGGLCWLTVSWLWLLMLVG